MDEAESDLTETLKFTAPYDFSGNPTLSIPWPAATGEVPASFQLVGRHFDEGGLIRLGRLLEEQRGELAPALTS